MKRGGGLELSKQLLLGASAIALMAPVAANAQAPSRQWDGAYVGWHAGYGWGSSDVNCSVSGLCTSSFNTSGAIGGGQVGYNLTIGKVLLGIEGDIAFAGIDGDTFFEGKNAQSEMDWIATLRARAGLLATDKVLVYGTGGVAWAGWNDSIGGVVTGDWSTTYTGYAAGGGIEAIVAKGVSLKLEYLFVDFGDETHNAGGSTANFDHEVHTIKIGVNFKLN
jgi:outer membrane immunogenic protein